MKHPETYEEYLEAIKPIIKQTGYDEIGWTLIFNFHNNHIFPERTEWSKSCSACRKRVKQRVDEWWKANIDPNL